MLENKFVFAYSLNNPPEPPPPPPPAREQTENFSYEPKKEPDKDTNNESN